MREFLTPEAFKQVRNASGGSLDDRCAVVAMPAPQNGDLPAMCSPRGALLEVRREFSGRHRKKPSIETQDGNAASTNAARLRSRGGIAAFLAPRDRSRGALPRVI
jgi:hypothetical protein